MLNIKSCVFYSTLSNVTRSEFFLAAGKYGARFLDEATKWMCDWRISVPKIKGLCENLCIFCSKGVHF